MARVVTTIKKIFLSVPHSRGKKVQSVPPCQPTRTMRTELQPSRLLCALSPHPLQHRSDKYDSDCDSVAAAHLATFSQHTLEIITYNAINHDKMVMYSVPCVYQVCVLISVAFYAQNCVIWFTQGVAPVWHRPAIYSLRCCSLPLPSTFFFPQLSTCWEYHHCTLHHGNHFCNTQGACDIQTHGQQLNMGLVEHQFKQGCVPKQQLKARRALHVWHLLWMLFTGLLQERDLEISWFHRCDSLGRMQVAAHHLECNIWGQRQSSLCAPSVLNVYQPLVSNEVSSRDKSCEREKKRSVWQATRH